MTKTLKFGFNPLIFSPRNCACLDFARKCIFVLAIFFWKLPKLIKNKSFIKENQTLPNIVRNVTTSIFHAEMEIYISNMNVVFTASILFKTCLSKFLVFPKRSFFVDLYYCSCDDHSPYIYSSMRLTRSSPSFSKEILNKHVGFLKIFII